MKVPINWLKNYIDIEHSSKEFGDIMTNLEFMQDGPIKNEVIDLEVRQNRPDVLSILGVAREYAAFTNKPVRYPEQKNDIKVAWGTQKKIINVEAEDIVIRFTAVKINNIKINISPDYIKENLQAYGIQPINNIVDITNYVMLEYGIPMHAFDTNKLSIAENRALLNLRMAQNGEKFTTWQGTKVTLDTNDLVVADANNRLVSIGGITGEEESGISEGTKNIILEAANYEYAYIRRTAVKHNIVTESSIRHSKILPSNMVGIAIKRALTLIQELAGGEIELVEDYYKKKQENITIKFESSEIERLSGLKLEDSVIENLLLRLGFEVLSKNNNVWEVKVPSWRTDITLEADLVEEVLRLYGYDKIPTTQINTAPPKQITPKILLLENKIKDILVSLGLQEQITEPLIEAQNIENEIVLENPLNKEKNSLRTSLKQTLLPVAENYIKAGKNLFGLFEVGKVYYKNGETFKEEKRVQTIYNNTSTEKIKGDLQALLLKLGINLNKIQTKKEGDVFNYYLDAIIICALHNIGFELYTENIEKIVDINKIPAVHFKTGFVQRIEEQVTVEVKKDSDLSKIEEIFMGESDKIYSVYLTDIYKVNEELNALTFTIVFEDVNKKLTKEYITEIKEKAVYNISKEVIN
ncbi:hypothetical protein COV24_04820 [candidate division WWE3 bacterium CG10_big_fil_rev_8_21_14_0_10_32_10]|uniref:Phenylalanine--tRNA ligase beta subunit n=1 Tax=candidate division WWE3 bacterium CG10_big_fil_rev_8_21_14_0_10_32_10 TaxID=1975090 RepID=A0A2H0R937_UNCKA|nr:MAG: hypothetical protein COV24_04820 [candidate division WWE3 bacterium CG10_big_fil_rev_8_21_14_0_10_32_10]